MATNLFSKSILPMPADEALELVELALAAMRSQVCEVDLCGLHAFPLSMARGIPVPRPVGSEYSPKLAWGQCRGDYPWSVAAVEAASSTW